MDVDDRAGMSAEERSRLEADLAGQDGLDDVFAWGRRQRPLVVPEDVVIQDEFTHDVIVPWRSGRYLVYDTT